METPGEEETERKARGHLRRQIEEAPAGELTTALQGWLDDPRSFPNGGERQRGRIRVWWPDREEET